jgi:hypothetical protein
MKKRKEFLLKCHIQDQVENYQTLPHPSNLIKDFYSFTCLEAN